jgi:hypothetical protein
MKEKQFYVILVLVFVLLVIYFIAINSDKIKETFYIISSMGNKTHVSNDTHYGENDILTGKKIIPKHLYPEIDENFHM